MAFTTTLKLKDFFFDRAVVKDAISDAERRNLSKIGAFLRRRARSSLRRRKKVSQPGKPPSVRSRSIVSLKTILFAYEPTKHSVVVGPVLFKTGQTNVNLLGKTVPEILEFGGPARVTEFQAKSQANPDDWFPKNPYTPLLPWQRQRVRSVTYAARPYMSAALAAEIEAGTITDVWRNSIG